MTALVLVVDDIPANVKLLEAKLSNEYYNVITANDGLSAYEMARQHKPDLILLDVMMPGIDGFETCRRIKEDPSISHIPVVMVTALSDTSDRVNGLEAGADDFITKPINDTALFARVRSLVRIKVLMDELRLRDKTENQMGVMNNDTNSFTSDVSGSKIFLIDDDMVQTNRISEQLNKDYQVTALTNPETAISKIPQDSEQVDLIIVSTQLCSVDGLRIATQIKNIDPLRHVPVVMMVDEDDSALMLKGLELGLNDYLIMPIDGNEMKARVRTQIRRKKYQDALKANYQASISLAITDQLTGLYNRHYLDAHLQNTVQQSLTNRKPMSVMIMDMDHFKPVNDTYGHQVGDEVLQQIAQVIIGSVRSSDLAARFGGEEFVVLLPETDFMAAYELADRIRRRVERFEFKVSHEVGVIQKTISIGIATLNMGGDTSVEMIKRADEALYAAKHNGRNLVAPIPQHLQHAQTQPENKNLESGF